MKAYELAEQSHDARNDLITEHIPMARRIARRLGRNARPNVREDLEATAVMGLVEAASRFDFSRSEPFGGFAYRRIRGAVLDSMRRGDILPRRLRTLSNKAGKKIAELEQTLGRPPEDEEVATALGMTPDAYRTELAKVAEVSFVELGPEADATTARDDFENVSAFNVAHRRQLLSRVKEGIRKLEKRDAQLLNLYYVDELTFAEIGEVFGVSEARVCQLHARALVRVRAAIGQEA